MNNDFHQSFISNLQKILILSIVIFRMRRLCDEVYIKQTARQATVLVNWELMEVDQTVDHFKLSKNGKITLKTYDIVKNLTHNLVFFRIIR